MFGTRMAEHGRYSIVRKVADGGMAEIFLATQLGREGFQKPVILKRIHSAIYADPQFRNMFIDEAHISMGLSHSNIVQILDLGVGDGRYFLVLELVDGWDLGRVLARASTAGVPLPRELGLHVVAEVCRALSYAHSQTDGDRPLGIVHRDVSPHNVLLSAQGEVKLTDFGIAKAMNKREHTGAGVVKGKVAFMAPEQALGRDVDARSDLFALGTVLYLLMTRVRPFEGPTDLEILLRVQKAEFRPARHVQPELEPAVDAIITRAMRLDPAERYQSADEMLADVERVLRGVFRPVGQSELKRWLAELGARDGVPSIAKGPPGPAAAGHSGSGELEGKDVVLSDSRGSLDVGADEPTLAVLEPSAGGGSRGRARIPHPELALPVPEDGEAALSGRHSRSQFTLPIPDEDGPPGRRRGRRRGGLSILIFGVLLVGAAAGVGRYLGLRADGPVGEAAARGERPAPPPTAADAGSAAAHAEEQAPAGAAAAASRHQQGASETAAHEAAHEPAARDPAAREPANRHAHPTAATERAVEDHARHSIAEIKNQMAPDPSLLPPPAPSPPQPAAPPPKAAEPAAPPPPPPPPPAPEKSPAPTASDNKPPAAAEKTTP
jgi:serine/threonine protein kinase